MALSNINPQTFTVPDKQVLLYLQGQTVYYKRYSGTTGTLDDKTLKALGIAKQQLPCLIYDADLVRTLNLAIIDTNAVTIATGYKATLQYIKQASHKKLDKHIYLNDQSVLLTKIDNNTSAIASLKEAISNKDDQNKIVVTQLVNSKITIPNNKLPIVVKTNKGNLYNIDFNYVTQTQQSYQIDPAVYLAYDNSQTFQGSWTIYLITSCNCLSNSQLHEEFDALKVQVQQSKAIIQQMQQTIDSLQTRLNNLQQQNKELTQCV